MPEPGIPPNVFIGYAKEDHAFACEVYQGLKAAAMLPWMDRPPEAFALEALPGHDRPLQIEQRLGEADCVVLILSRASIEKQGFVQGEFRLALHAVGRRPRRLPVVAVLHETCDVPAFAAGGVALNELAWIDYTAGGIAPVVAEIRRHAAPRTAPPAPGKKTGAITQPKIRWRAFAGRVHWRNNMSVHGGLIYLSSCGTRWNQDDRGDGVYCLEAETGATRWAANSAGDANELLLHGDEIVFGTDAGQLAVLDKATGALKQEHRVWHAIFARPFALRADGAERVFAISHKGVVLMVDSGAGAITQVATLPFPVRANVTVSEDGQSGILFGETGEIARVWSDASGFQCELLATKTYVQAAAQKGRRNAGLVASPIRDGASVIGGVTRDTYYDSPPLFRFDVQRKEFLWGEREEEEPRGKESSFGNMRNQPLVLGKAVIFAPAYAAALFAADKETGKILWKIPVGQELLQQWSSPVKVDERRVLLARADGILYQIDIEARKIEWALSLLVTPAEIQAASRTGKLGPGPSEAAHNGITATPLWDNGRILLGTTEGELFCIEQAG
jgi:outer membrane protein assembly factor BamB